MFVYLCLFIDGCSLNPLLGYSFIKRPTSNICGDWNKSTYGGTPPPIQLPSLPAFIVNSQTPWVCVCGYSSYMTKFCPHHSFTDPHRPQTMILWPPLHLGVNTPVCCGQHSGGQTLGLGHIGTGNRLWTIRAGVSRVLGTQNMV